MDSKPDNLTKSIEEYIALVNAYSAEVQAFVAQVDKLKATTEWLDGIAKATVEHWKARALAAEAELNRRAVNQ